MYDNSTLDVVLANLKICLIVLNYTEKTLATSGYGIHKVAANTVRVVCESMNDNNGSYFLVGKLITS